MEVSADGPALNANDICGNGFDDWSPEGHSWILVPPGSPPSEQGHQPGVDGGTSPEMASSGARVEKSLIIEEQILSQAAVLETTLQETRNIDESPACCIAHSSSVDDLQDTLLPHEPVLTSNPPLPHPPSTHRSLPYSNSATAASDSRHLDHVSSMLRSSESRSPTPPSPTPPSPQKLCNSLIHDGESVAELAVSQILIPDALIGISPACGPSLSASSASHDADPLKGGISPDNARISTPRKLGILPAVSRSVHCGICTDEDSGNDAFFNLADWLDYSQMLHSRIWSRPFALIAILLASHSAVLLLGVMVGRHQTAAAGYAAEATLVRRFSSGPYGTHARLLWP